MAVIGTKGFGALPKYCTLLMGAFFVAGMLICLVRDLMPRRFARYVPSPMAMSVPFYIGAASVSAVLRRLFLCVGVLLHCWVLRAQPHGYVCALLHRRRIGGS